MFLSTIHYFFQAWLILCLIIITTHSLFVLFKEYKTNNLSNFKNRSSSILSWKIKNNSPYNLIDLIHDVYFFSKFYLFKKPIFTIIYFFCFIISYLLFKVFIFLYIIILYYRITSIIYYVIFKKDIEITFIFLKTPSKFNIFFVVNESIDFINFLTLSVIYNFLAFKKKKINIELFLNFLLNKVIFLPLKVIFWTHYFGTVIEKISHNEVWQRKKKKIWFSLFIRLLRLELSDKFLILKSQNNFIYGDYKIIIKNRYIKINPNTTSLSFYVLNLESLISDISKTHIAKTYIKNRPHFTVFRKKHLANHLLNNETVEKASIFTSSELIKIKTFDKNLIPSIHSVSSYSLDAKKSSQKFIYSALNKSELNIEQGTLLSVWNKLNLINFDEFSGLMIKLILLEQLHLENYFLYQSNLDSKLIMFNKSLPLKLIYSYSSFNSFNLSSESILESYQDFIKSSNGDYSFNLKLEDSIKNLSNKEIFYLAKNVSPNTNNLVNALLQIHTQSKNNLDDL